MKQKIISILYKLSIYDSNRILDCHLGHFDLTISQLLSCQNFNILPKLFTLYLIMCVFKVWFVSLRAFCILMLIQHYSGVSNIINTWLPLLFGVFGFQWSYHKQNCIPEGFMITFCFNFISL